MYNAGLNIYFANCDQAAINALKAESGSAPCKITFAQGGLTASESLAQADLVITQAKDCASLAALAGSMRDSAELILVSDAMPGPDCQALLADIWPEEEQALRFQMRHWLDRFAKRQRLLEKEYYLDALLGNSPSLIWFKDKAGIHELVSESFCAAVGKTRGQVQGQGHAYIWNVEADDPACIESERIVMETGRIHESEEEITTGNGKRLLAVRKAPLRDSDGSMRGTVGIAMDITNEREYQQRLIQNNAMLETMFETMDCGLLVQSLDSGKVISANKAAVQLLGYDSEQELSNHFSTIAETVVDEDRKRLCGIFAQLKQPADSTTYEYRVRHADGSIRHIIGNARLMEKDGELVCRRFLFDCTEQRLAEERERREEEKRQQELVRALSVDFQLAFVCASDRPDTILQLLNEPDPDLKRIFSSDKPLQAQLGEYIATCIHPEDREASSKAFSLAGLRENLVHCGIYYHNYRTLRGDETHHFQMKAIAAGDPASPYAIVVGLQSIDDAIRTQLEQKSILAEALEQAQRASNAKSIFLSNMSHDIRTPLNAVLGYARLAKSRLDRPDAAAAYLDKIQNSGTHLISLINDILDMSHIESGRIKLDESLCSLPELLSEMIALVQPDADRKRQNLRLEIGKLENPDIFCDKLRVRQVLLNLLSNAIKYTQEEGSILLALRQTECRLPGHAAYEISVEDNGMGMDGKFLERIFEPFERAGNVGAIQGTGLGMAITKSIVDLMKGAISVTSKPDCGTTFRLQLAFKVPESVDEAACIAHEAEQPEQGAAGGRILLAEDNEMNQEIACEILGEAGYQIEVAGNGREAVDLLSSRGPGYFDLVLMDVQMPIMDGYAATGQIRSLADKRLAQIPIIAMTANSFEEDRQEALNRGMNAHIAKPINFPELFGTIAEFMQGAKTAE